MMFAMFVWKVKSTFMTRNALHMTVVFGSNN